MLQHGKTSWYIDQTGMLGCPYGCNLLIASENGEGTVAAGALSRTLEKFEREEAWHLARARIPALEEESLESIRFLHRHPVLILDTYIRSQSRAQFCI